LGIAALFHLEPVVVVPRIDRVARVEGRMTTPAGAEKPSIPYPITADLR
jgi:hypothetical protein